MDTPQRERVLVIAHAHPDFSLGGGEIAAYNYFKSYRKLPEVEDAWFLARLDRHRPATGGISLRRENEYVWETGVRDWHLMKTSQLDATLTWFADLIRALKPTIVHVNHYVHIGLEFLRVIKEVDPEIRIYLTLHEYIAICSNSGQMIKTNGRLCSRESFDECRQCFPERSAEDFWLRKHFFQSYFSLIDGFTAPSEFLRGRYVDWGIPPEKIVVIENGQQTREPLPPRALAEGETRNRFAFFGQVTPFKGLDVLLEAIAGMRKSERKRIVLEINGANLENQSNEYRRKVEELRAPLIKEGVVRWVGPYQPDQIGRRMEGADWIVVPSIWWENSPMVIQEAFVHGRPLLVSDIGGMAEKVTDGVDGVHVSASNTLAWRDALLRLAGNDDEWHRLAGGIRRPLSYDDAAREALSAFAKWKEYAHV